MTRVGVGLIVARAGIAVVVFTVTTLTWLALAPTTFAATSSVYVKSGQRDAASTFQRGLYEQNRLQTYAALARSSVVCTAAADRAGIAMTPAQIAREMTVQVLPQTVIITITVEDHDPALAKNLSIAVAEELSAQGNEIEQEGGSSPVSLFVYDRAIIPAHPTSPDSVRITLLCALLGLLLGLVLPLPRPVRPHRGHGLTTPRTHTDIPSHETVIGT